VAPEEDFRRLSEEWMRETGMLSSISKKVKHPAYLKIIGMGRPVVPLILRALRERRAFWFEALRQITGEDPTAGAGAKNPSQVADAWLEWGRKNGHID
jgi:hypothetical protein